MLGFESLEQKLREEGAPSAPATVVAAKAGIPISEGSNDWDQTDITRWHYTLDVHPGDGTPPFEAKIAIRVNHIKLDEGQQVVLLYDPADHSRVALDRDATQSLGGDSFTSRSWGDIDFGGDADPSGAAEPAAGDAAGPVAPAAASVADDVDALQKLADLHTQGALTDAEFAAEKAKILGRAS